MNRPIHMAETRASDPPLKNRYQLSNQVDSDLSSGRHVKLRNKECSGHCHIPNSSVIFKQSLLIVIVRSAPGLTDMI